MDLPGPESDFGSFLGFHPQFTALSVWPLTSETDEMFSVLA